MESFIFLTRLIIIKTIKYNQHYTKLKRMTSYTTICNDNIEF